MMIRLISTSIWKRSLPLLNTAVKEGVVGHPPFSHHVRVCPSVRSFSAGCPAMKDVTPKPEQQPEEERGEQMDLDGWKSLMRSQVVTADEKKGDDDGGELGAEGLVTPVGAGPGDAEEDSILEATRVLVLMWREAGRTVPEEMTDEQVRELAALTTKSSMKKYLKFLSLKENRKKGDKEKKQRRRAEWESTKDDEDEEGGGGEGRPLKNTFLLKYWNRALDRLLAWRSAQSMVFGQPLVFDMSYEQNMSPRELVNTVNQLMEVEAWNRRAAEPFHLHFCNLQPEGAYAKELHKRYGDDTFDRLMITSTDTHHADAFPRERLVYLTADSPNTLRTFDHTKVYVVGALVDRSTQKGASLANAKRLNLATARLPLGECLHWGMGAKNLTLDQMIRILLTIKDTGKWEDALSFVPQRKHDGFNQQQQPEKWVSPWKGGRVKRDRKGSGFNRAERSEANPTQPDAYREKFLRLNHVGPNRDDKSAVIKLRPSLKTLLDAKTSGRRKSLLEEE